MLNVITNFATINKIVLCQNMLYNNHFQAAFKL